MAISIFYGISGLSVLFFAAFFIQCCRLAPRKNNQFIRKQSISDIVAPAETRRLLAQWEKEMAEFLARQGRSTALLFLIAPSGIPLLSLAIPSAHPDAPIGQISHRASSLFGQGTSLDRSQAAKTPCKKN